MVDLDQALEIADKRRSGIDYCYETKNTYRFVGFDAPESCGGFQSPVVVIKKTGECMDYVSYIWHEASKEDEDIREFFLK